MNAWAIWLELLLFACDKLPIMPNTFLRIALLLSLSVCASFGQARHVTLTLRGGGGSATNEIQLAEYETAELVSHSVMGPGGMGWVATLTATKDNAQLSANMVPAIPNGSYTYGYTFQTFIVAGPAKIRIVWPGQSDYFATFRITPESFPPDRTIIAMPGTNQTSITLECSTNLVQWSPATNGVYGPMPEAKFFRIKAQATH